MQRATIAEIMTPTAVGKEVEVRGWLRTKRTAKKCAFLIVNDGSSQHDLQIVADENTRGYASLAEFTTGASVYAHGKLAESRGHQELELLATEIEVVGTCAGDYPLQKKGHTLEFLRDCSHLRARTNTFGAVFRIKHTASIATHDFFNREGFFWLQAPIITPNDSEGAGELFTVTPSDNDDASFFGNTAYLAVSGQLYAEAAALSLGKVYTFAPTFRAENSNTTRHLAEFWMLEPEVAFADLNDIVELGIDYISFVTQKVLEERATELEFLQKHYEMLDVAQLKKTAERVYERITYTEAIALLQKATHKKFVFPPKWGADLQTEHEKYLAGEVFSGNVLVSDFPKDIKPFYMRENDDGKTVAALDLLLPGIGELIGGSAREDRYDVLAPKTPAGLEWYLNLRRYGGTPHAGWGLGFERLLQFLTGMQNIRDVVFSPRAPQLMHF